MTRTMRQICILALAMWATAIPSVKIVYASEKFDGFSFLTGEEIYKLCRSGEASDQRACAMYVCGMVDGWQAEEIINHKKSFQYCLRAGVTCKELGASIPKYLDENPETRQSGAGGAVLNVLVHKYGCQ